MSTGSRVASNRPVPAMTYGKSARVYDALCRHKDYATASSKLRDIVQRVTPDASSLLDVACGTGRHLEHLRRDFRVEGLDLSPDMCSRTVSRRTDGIRNAFETPVASMTVTGTPPPLGRAA